MLTSLDRKFEATFTGERVGRLLSAQRLGALLRRGILVSAGRATTIPYCICELRNPTCLVRLEEDGGVLRGYCNEAGRPLDVSEQQARRLQFSWRAWAEWMRRRSALGGDGPVLGAGALYVGSGNVIGRAFGLVVVAPGCRRGSDVVFPPEARRAGRPLVAMYLGERIPDLHLEAVIPLTALGDDFGTLDAGVIERAIEEVPHVIVSGEKKCVVYDHERRRAAPIDDAEYQRLLRPETRRQFGLLIDRLSNRIWRSGRLCRVVRDSRGQSREKQLGPLSVSLLADYVRRPGFPMTAKQTRTYKGSPTSESSASAQLSEVRRSVEGGKFILSGGRADRAAERAYYFEPGAMTWCLIDPLPMT